MTPSADLSQTMEIRRHGAEVPVTADGLARAYPQAARRVVVFVHGLCGTEATWCLPARGSDRSDRRTYGHRLEQELGFSSVWLRYNTGRHISDNGRDLAALMDVWPPHDRALGRARWDALGIDERRTKIAAGYRAWAREVAGITEISGEA